MGNYPQTFNGDIKPIEWQVLSKGENKMLVISKYGLDARRFDSSSNNWKNSEIRKWLNSDFYNSAFSEQEKKSINLSNLSDVGTTDNIFLLSKEEVEKYFANYESIKCQSTDYAKKNGAIVSNGYSSWWLRSHSSFSNNHVFCVSLGNDIDDRNVNWALYVARPALWINL